MRAAPEQELFVSVLTFAEIRFGIEILAAGKRRRQLEEWLDDLRLSFELRLLPVTASIGDRWAVLSAQAQQRGSRLSMADGLIAATALEHGQILVTRNVKDFAALGIEILNPWES
jgi:toxin FitB